MVRIRSFEDALDLKYNSFDFLRLILALLVLYHHTFVLGGFGEEPIKKLLTGQQNLGNIAVLGFFLISGFLVTNSILRSSSIISYGWKRFLRIYPAFWVCLIVTAFVFAPLVHINDGKNLESLLSHKEGSFSYLGNNFFIFMHQYQIAGLLSDNPFPFAFDGSLWTLVLEVKAYVTLGIFGLLGWLKRPLFILGIFIVLYVIFLNNISFPEPENKFLHFFIDDSVFLFFTYFLTGAVFFLFRKYIPHSFFFFIIAIGITAAIIFFGVLNHIIPITLAYILFWLASVLPFQSAGKYGDFSYGIYIYSFPILQLLSYYHLNTNYGIYTFSAVILSFLLAGFSWHMIEKPSIRLKKIPIDKFLSNYTFFFFKNPTPVPAKTAKSERNWREGKTIKPRISRT